jgi:hypothetical protein
MQLRVHERDNEVHIEVSGVAGRQDQVLQALNSCQFGQCGHHGALGGGLRGDVQVRSRINDMRIRLRPEATERFDAVDIYRCLRRALIERPAIVAEAVVAAAAAV